jgi:CubicO group peptidase (beta-lactamase class C family)
MPTFFPTIALFTALSFSATAQDSQVNERAFPASTALAESVFPDSLDSLGDLVQSFVDDEEVVGAELLVIKNGRSILHEAYGWRDREAQVAMETGSVFCVRSMTKPFIGASILMLVDDREIKLDDHIAEYLPSFDVEGSRDITVEHLLTHTSGLPMSLLLGKNLRELEDIQAVAELGAGYKLDFEPGSAFQYSDQGTDTLTALVEVISGMSAADFVSTRLLEPLGMQESVCVMTEDHPLRARGCVKYVGSRGFWARFWGPDEPPLFPDLPGIPGPLLHARGLRALHGVLAAQGALREGATARHTLCPQGAHPRPAPNGGADGPARTSDGVRILDAALDRAG